MDNQLKNNDFIFTEAALIYEAEMEDMFDFVVLITAKDNIRMKRVSTNGKLTQEEFKKRDKNQIRDEEKKKRADFIFDNNSNIKDLKQKAEFLITILTGLGSSKN